MYWTAKLLHDRLQQSADITVSRTVNSKWCVGEGAQLMDHVYTSSESRATTDLIIVWEHHEIVEMIRRLGIHMPKWRKTHVNEYSLVLQMDVTHHKLYYDCFDYRTNQTGCSEEIAGWLHDYGRIPPVLESRHFISPTWLSEHQIKQIFGIGCILGILLALIIQCITGQIYQPRPGYIIIP